ncbi:MAG: helix-turn-helix transcriptional regulator [Phycisphaerales bacterium]|nr:MAG: helix-turn-helix transcriptional regulator [Phycisphaerales bacterium]
MPPDRKTMQNIGLTAVLKALESGRMSGYELVTALTPGTGNGPIPGGHCEVYAHLYLLEAKGLVRGEWEALPTGRRRRYYEITSRGLRRLARNSRRQEALGRSIAAVRGLLGPSPEGCARKGALA